MINITKIRHKLYTVIFLFFLTGSLEASTDPAKVLVIGHGFMGKNHVKNLEKLQQQHRVCIVGIVDTDPKRLEKLPYPCFQNVKLACQQTFPDIVVVATNTQTHDEIIKTVVNTCEKLPALFIEKPLVETSVQADAIRQFLEEKGYPTIPITCGYLFRHSAIVDEALAFLKEKQFKISHVEVFWHKQREPTRPSAGVHIDEATHPVDLLLNRILRALEVDISGMTLHCLSRKQDDSIIDKVLQRKIYHRQLEKMNPVAEVEFEIKLPDFSMHFLSSFILPPLRREILLECIDGTRISLSFDQNQSDQLLIESPLPSLPIQKFYKTNKLLNEWVAFLKFYESGETNPILPTLEDMTRDIRITELLESL